MAQSDLSTKTSKPWCISQQFTCPLRLRAAVIYRHRCLNLSRSTSNHVRSYPLFFHKTPNNFVLLQYCFFYSVHGNQWYVHMPLKAKALALAAFLASRNPPATDRSTFGQATKGRRKKTKGDPASRPSSGGVGGSQPQCFGVERLLGIYRQVLPSISAGMSSMPINKYRRIRNIASAGEIDKKISIFSVDSLRQKHQNTKSEALLYTMV